MIQYLNSSIFSFKGTSFFKVTKFWKLISYLFIYKDFFFGCLISSAFSKRELGSKLVISKRVVFTPIPDAPGILSIESPANA